MSRGDKIWLIIVSVALLSAGLFVYFFVDYAEYLPPSKFVSAEVTVFDDYVHPSFNPPAKINITDEKEVAKLEAFFPGVGHHRAIPSMGSLTGGWSENLEVKFKRKNGSFVNVIACVEPVERTNGRSFWYEQYSLGGGGVTRGGFAAYLQGRLKARVANGNGGEQ